VSADTTQAISLCTAGGEILKDVCFEIAQRAADVNEGLPAVDCVDRELLVGDKVLRETPLLRQGDRANAKDQPAQVDVARRYEAHGARLDVGVEDHEGPAGVPSAANIREGAERTVEHRRDLPMQDPKGSIGRVDFCGSMVQRERQPIYGWRVKARAHHLIGAVVHYHRAKREGRVPCDANLVG